jgi:hypothetical protein
MAIMAAKQGNQALASFFISCLANGRARACYHYLPDWYIDLKDLKLARKMLKADSYSSRVRP